MVNRERFMLDVDSEGFPHRYDEPPHPVIPLVAARLGQAADHAVVQALLADHKCLQCEPVDQVIPAVDYTHIEQRALAWAEEAREIVRQADTNMLANSHIDGITRLSDRYAPDAFFGWKR